MNNPVGGTVGPGQVISLTRRSAWRREYEMRAGERALGWVRWQPGRRCFAQAEGRGLGLIDLATRPASHRRQGRCRGTASDRRPRARRLGHPHRRGPRPPMGEDGTRQSLGDA